MMVKAVKYFLLFVFAFGLTENIFCQNKQLDSLKLLLKNAKNDSVKCLILNVLAETAPDDEWPAYNEALKSIAEKDLPRQYPCQKKTIT